MSQKSNKKSTPIWLQIILGLVTFGLYFHLLAEGGQLADPAGFVKRLNDMLLGMALK